MQLILSKIVKLLPLNVRIFSQKCAKFAFAGFSPTDPAVGGLQRSLRMVNEYQPHG